MYARFKKWKRTNKVLAVLTFVFLLGSPISFLQFKFAEEQFRSEQLCYHLGLSATYGTTYYGSNDIYSIKTEVMGIMKVIAPMSCLIIGGICGTILWCRKPNDNLDVE
jgi:hypothetical protein